MSDDDVNDERVDQLTNDSMAVTESLVGTMLTEYTLSEALGIGSLRAAVAICKLTNMTREQLIEFTGRLYDNTDVHHVCVHDSDMPS